MRSIAIIGIATLALAASSNAAAVEVHARAYVAAAAAELERAFATFDGRIELEPRGKYSDLKLRDVEAVQLRVRSVRAEMASLAVVWVDIVSGGRALRRVPVRFGVRWFRSALVARARLSSRTALTPEMFELRETDTAHLGGRVVTQFAEIVGQRLRRDVTARAVLALDAIEARPPIETGEVIQVTATVGGVRVQRAAIAQRDGFAGQRIAARVVDGSDVLRVEVVGEDLAKVYGDG